MSDYGYQDFYDAWMSWAAVAGPDHYLGGPLVEEWQEGSPYQTIFEGLEPEAGFNLHQYNVNDDILSALAGVFSFPPGTTFEHPPGSLDTGYIEDYTIGDEGFIVDHGGFQGSLENLGTALPFVDIYDEGSIAHHLSELYGMDTDPIRASEISALTPEQVSKTKRAHYQPYEESEAEKLVRDRVSEVADVATGSFAASGARQKGLSAAENMYKRGYANILKDIMELQGS